MRILFLADINPSSHDLVWVNYFAKKHEVYLISNNPIEIKIKNYGFTFLGHISDFSILRPFRLLRDGMRIRSFIKKFDIEVFHIFYAEPNALWAIFKPLLNCKLGLTTRGTDVLKTIPDFRKHKSILLRYPFILYQYAFHRFHFITSTSERQIDSIKNLFGRKENIFLIRTGVDASSLLSFNLDQQEYGKFILFPRSMKPIYYHEFAIESIKKLPTDILEQYKFVFIDKDSPDSKYVEKIENLMDECGSCRFHFLPRQSKQDLYCLFKSTELVVMTPLSDGSPVTAIEAMLFKKPVILPPLAYDEDIFDDNVYRLNEWNSSELAELIAAILKNKDVIKLENAYSNALSKGNFNVEMKKLESIFNTVNEK